MSDGDKITEAHRRLRAIVYVRQSSPGQVQNNHESRALQCELQQQNWLGSSVAGAASPVGELWTSPAY